jgi:hypothetical protein
MSTDVPESTDPPFSGDQNICMAIRLKKMFDHCVVLRRDSTVLAGDLLYPREVALSTNSKA